MVRPSNDDLIAAMRELLEALGGDSEERCLLAIARQQELLDEADAAGRPRREPAPTAHLH